MYSPFHKSLTLLDFTHKASMTSVHIEMHRVLFKLMSVFVNELTPAHVRSQQGQCVQQCQTIIKGALQ